MEVYLLYGEFGTLFNAISRVVRTDLQALIANGSKRLEQQLFWSRKKKIQPETNFLDLIPGRRMAFEKAPGDEQVVLLAPRYSDPLLGRWIQPRLGPSKRYIRIPLEARGSFLWDRIDGIRPIGSLVSEFAQAFPEDADQVSERVCHYLYVMRENKFIYFINFDD